METIAFARGVPSPELIPVDQLRQCIDTALAADPNTILSYGTGGGYPPLREMLAEWHGVEPSRVIVTTGSLQGFVFLVQHLIDAAAGQRRTIVVENPTYDRPLLVVLRTGSRVVSIDVDDNGMDVDTFDRLTVTDSPLLTYVIPNFQNPAGATMSEERRVRLLEIARERSLLVVEDDPYGKLYFDTPPPRTLFERANGAPVVYTSSFSKMVSPGLRVGYMILPDLLAPALERLANDTYISSSMIGQAAAVEYVRQGHLEENLERCRIALRARCDAMCEALAEWLPEVTYTRPGGGYFLWARLPEDVSADDLLPIAAQHGVSFVPGKAFGERNESELRLAFSYPTIDAVREGVRRLAGAVDALRSATVRG